MFGGNYLFIFLTSLVLDSYPLQNLQFFIVPSVLKILNMLVWLYFHTFFQVFEVSFNMETNDIIFVSGNLDLCHLSIFSLLSFYIYVLDLELGDYFDNVLTFFVFSTNICIFAFIHICSVL